MKTFLKSFAEFIIRTGSKEKRKASSLELAKFDKTLSKKNKKNSLANASFPMN